MAAKKGPKAGAVKKGAAKAAAKKGAAPKSNFRGTKQSGKGTKKSPIKIKGSGAVKMTPAQRAKAGKVFAKAASRGLNPRYAAAKGKSAVSGGSAG